MKKFTPFHVCILLLSLIAIFCGCAEKTSSKAFIVGVEEAFPPMGYMEKGELVGYDIELATEAAKRLGYAVKFQVINWDKRKEELKSRNIDCIWSGYTITPERSQKILFTPPYLQNSQIFIVRQNSDITRKDDLKGKRIGTQADSSGYDAVEADEAFKNNGTTIMTYSDCPTALWELESGQIDALVTDLVVADYETKRTGKTFKILDEHIAVEEYGIGFRLEDQKLRDALWGALKAMEADGTVAKISQKWFGQNLSVIGKDN